MARAAGERGYWRDGNQVNRIEQGNLDAVRAGGPPAATASSGESAGGQRTTIEWADAGWTPIDGKVWHQFPDGMGGVYDA